MVGLINILVPVVAAAGLAALAAQVLNGIRRPTPVPVKSQSRERSRR